MGSRMLDMTRGKPVSLIVSFALPLMIGNAFQQLYIVVDTIVVGKALGVHALAALGAADWLNWMVLGVIQGMTQGFAILMAQQFGSRQEEKLKNTIGLSVILAAVSAVVFLLASQVFLEPILILLQTPDTIRPVTMLYLRIMFSGIPVVLTFNLLASILRAVGDGQTPLYAMIVAGCINVALDLLFVLVFHWGIAGAAAATLIAQVCSAIYCLHQMRKMPLLKISVKHMCLDVKRAWRMIRLGMPVAFQNVVIAIGGLVIQSAVNGFGVTLIAGFTATNKFIGVLEIAATSFGYAMVTYAGQNLGAGNIGRIRSGMRVGILLSLLTSAVIAAVMIAFGKNILLLFISGNPDEVTATLDVAYYYLVLVSVFLPVLYVLHVTRSVIQGMGNTFLPMISGIAEFVMRVGTVWVLPAVIGFVGAFYAEVFAWVGADLILIPSYFIVIKKWERILCENRI